MSVNINSLVCVMFFVSFNAFSNDSEDDFIVKASRSGMSTVSFEAFSDKKIGKLSTKLKSNNIVYGFEVQGSIDDEKDIIFADLDGLKNGNKFTANIQVWDVKIDSKKTVRKLSKACKVFNELRGEIFDSYAQCRENIKNANKGNPVAEIDNIVAKECAKEIKEVKSTKGSCDVSDEINPVLSSYIYNLTLAVGEQKFDWVEGDSFDSKSDSKVSYSIETEFGYITKDYNRFNIGFRYEDRWKSNNPQNLCIPLQNDSSVTSCRNLVIGSPNNIDNRIGYIEWKSYLGDRDQFGISTRYSYDFEDDISAVYIPLYLYSVLKSNELQGGVSLGWNSEDSDTLFSLFFSKAFKISG